MPALVNGCWKGDLRQKDNFLHWFNDVEEMNQRIADVEFSVTVSDPSQDDNPLIGCSSGFSALTGYSAEEIVGRNCRFLIDSVPDDHTVESERKKAREFSKACQKIALMGSTSEPGPPDCCCLQVNCHKNGTLFRNMFHMHFIRIDGKAYVVALQNEVPWELEISSSSYLQISNRYKMILGGMYGGHSGVSNKPEETFQSKFSGLNRWLVQSLSQLSADKGHCQRREDEGGRGEEEENEEADRQA
eukprot:gnl/MRDRNA2_/MRDRNA2_44487_c0_seq1.p1 gnl/MRDRNA2_/MRDRNA2_44487_c0~~gnl/MRDRNA2_/MRDRNA2_44487_c0_seq1.p1  ORF type:complete len:245 (-),score=46.15 gnl/MRDRNA2_/MRDRNA2_44487_c0_seq1:233-967(-)